MPANSSTRNGIGSSTEGGEARADVGRASARPGRTEARPTLVTGAAGFIGYHTALRLLERGDDVIGLGISAIGDVRGAYVQNEKKLSTYEECITSGRLPVVRGYARSADDDVRREVIHDLMCNFRVDMRVIEQRHGIRFREYFAEDLALLEDHEREGMVRVQGNQVVATAVGELFVRNLAMCFDRYQRESGLGLGESTVGFYSLSRKELVLYHDPSDVDETLNVYADIVKKVKK